MFLEQVFYQILGTLIGFLIWYLFIFKKGN